MKQSIIIPALDLINGQVVRLHQAIMPSKLPILTIQLSNLIIMYVKEQNNYI